MTTTPDGRAGESIDDWLEAGLGHHQLGQLRDAEALYRKVLSIRPDHPDALHLLGFVAYQCGLLDRALELISRASQLVPEAADYHNHLGLVLAAMGRSGEAIEAYGRALRLAPGFPEAHNNLGIVLRGSGRLNDAKAHYRAAVSERPAFADAWNNLGNIHRECGEYDAALSAFREALRLRPDFVEAHSNVLFNLSHYVLASPVQLLEAHRDWDARHGAAGRANQYVHARIGDPGKRLRIGYVSPDFRLHAASSFFAPLIASHDHQAFEIFCYAEVARPDVMTQHIRSYADVWRGTVGLADEAVARQIHEDGIDILVDLAGHTTGNRLQAFTWKPAPVQVAWLGYCATTGLAAMDYWVTDETIHPRDTVERAVESIVRLPRCWVSYRPPTDAPEIQMPRRTGITFGCFNERSKITPATIALWRRIMRALPESRLVLKARQYADESVCNSIVDAFAAHDIAADRIEFRPASAFQEYLAAYNDIDIALDPVPRTGGVTTADALWMGVPVITLCGERFIERHCASLLHAAGLDEWIAATPEDYVNKAIALARADEIRRGKRFAQRGQMAVSTLCDATSHARAMEATYRKMWHAYLGNTRSIA